MNKIHYAFGRDYLKSWTIEDALREIFQNYIDYGKYEIITKDLKNPELIHVTISNSYNPIDLSFLRLGNTSKNSGEFIGHHGEGLKAAFLIFTRENYFFKIITNNYNLRGSFEQSDQIGETLSIEYRDRPKEGMSYALEQFDYNDKFNTVFVCPKDIYLNFVNSIITDKDIDYSDGYYGDLLKDHIPNGNIYSGGLFVCNIKNLNYAYNIKPQHLQLDRDRRAPRDWDIDYNTSKILDSYLSEHKENVSYKPTNYNARDYTYNSIIPEANINNIEAVNVQGKVQYYDKNSNEMISNHNIRHQLDKHPKFKKVKELTKREKFNTRVKDTKRKQTTTLLKDFKKNHCGNNEEMNIDIDVILNRFNNKSNESRRNKRERVKN